MQWFTKGLELLQESEILYEKARLRPPEIKSILFQDIFQIGGHWMKWALRQIKAGIKQKRNPCFEELGYFKYGLALWTSLLMVCLFFQWSPWFAFSIAFFVFYAVEAQMVFLFPLLIEGVSNPLIASLRLTRKAGGTGVVVLTVITLAIYMIFGGFFKKGLKRCWCVGCLATLVWYRQLRVQEGMNYELS